ncbi:hypothetical protein [Mesorhizobium sp. L-8-3]|uniref:hypothetical protein n=1 Tax=Mesorhizobium sp. L-8-3 TaxID=2744522 RepID=UPI00193914CA|nr:hypothetical protein [Mesorhizobium sp. L-8-3]BCH26525.1 hypothetical protein MesoLjLb_63100 [Mesorhizobium sp. L-8-3]
MRSEGKIVAITSGGSGIGKETAARFIAEGAYAAINGRDVGKLEAASLPDDSNRRGPGDWCADAQPCLRKSHA